MMNPNASGTAAPATQDESVTEKIKDGAHRISEQASQVQEKVAEGYQAVEEKVTEGYHAIEEKAVEIREQASDVNDQVIHFIRDNPGISLIAALGAGYLLGSLASRRWLV